MINFKDYENMVRKIAHQKAKQFPSIEYDELVGRGALLFVETLGRWNPEKSQFGTFFYMVLKNEMVVWERGHGKAYMPQLGFEDTVLGVAGGCDPARQYEFKDSLSRMSEEAQEIIRIIFSAPEEILDNAAGPKLKAGNLRRKLKRMGWPEWTILHKFREIRQALSA